MANKFLESSTKKKKKKRKAKIKVENIRVEEIIKRKGDKLYIKWKHQDSSFNIWTNERNTI